MRAPSTLLFTACLLLAGCIGNTSGTAAVSLLAGRSVVYGAPGLTRADALWQEWDADGTTRTGGPSVFHDKTGRWKMERGTYCEIFGVSTEWTCWRMTTSDGGKRVRFWEIPDDISGLILFHKDLEGSFEG